MCGIAGIFSSTGLPNDGGITNMVMSLRHRGPDNLAIYDSPGKNCVLGHTRLSVIDLSPAGNQPMVDPETGNTIIFNGEIYNFQELRGECENRGDRFLSDTDTEVVLMLYRRYGVQCLDRLRGMFAFAIYDNNSFGCEKIGRLFIARDRLGKKPLNYALIPGGIIFASEIDSLVQHPLISRDMDLEALELYLQLGYIPAPWTIYRQVRKLSPGHYAIFDHAGLRIERYWELSYRHRLKINEQEALEGLEEKLKEAVRLRMISDVPIGALLSGGVDSSLVVALMAHISNKPVRTYSIGFKEEEFNEFPYAQQVAERYETEHHTEIIDGNIKDLLPLMVKHYGEPYADSSSVPSFLVCRAARQHVKVVLNGDGGDELLGGYQKFALYQRHLWTAHLLGHLVSPETVVTLVPHLVSPGNGLQRQFRRLVTGYIAPEILSLLIYRNFWNDRQRVGLLNGNATDLLMEWRNKLCAGAYSHAMNPVDRMSWMDNTSYLPYDLLVKMDIAAMHCGLEVRSPLLDTVVLEYCAGLPLWCKVRDGITKYLLKKLAERYLSSDILYRPKMGFKIPLEEWLRGPLAPLLRECLLNEALIAPLNLSVIRRTLDEFENHKNNHATRLWALLVYGYWKKYCLGVT